jgi:hypothetical protein
MSPFTITRTTEPAGSFAAGRWLAGEVWRVAAVDPAAFGGVSLLLLAAGLQACFCPHAAPRALTRWSRCGRSKSASGRQAQR